MDSSDIDRIARLERQVDFLFRRLGIDPDLALADDGELPSALDDAIARGKLIQVIKIYRKHDRRRAEGSEGCGRRDGGQGPSVRRPR